MHSNRENDPRRVPSAHEIIEEAQREPGPSATPSLDGDVARLVDRIAGEYAALPNVVAVALAGSLGGALGTDPHSDVDLYVYGLDDLSLIERSRIASSMGTGIEVGNTFWEDGDEWFVPSASIRVDVMLRRVHWIEDELERVLARHEPRLGYSTCFWYGVQHSVVLRDPAGWLAMLKARAQMPYPAPLRDAILSKNHPLLRNAHSAYLRQIETAAARGDLVSLNHRVAALLASYFDIVIAVNLRAHPGEKRLIQFVSEHCESKPARLEQAVGTVLASITDRDAVVGAVTQLVDDLDAWLDHQGILPRWPATP